MSYADQQFKATCRDILENGTSTKNEKVRPRWDDGTPAYTIKKFGIVNRYDLRKEFPAITLRRIGLKSAMDEILWIYQKKSNNIHELNSHIWDQWADNTGSIGKAYGYQMDLKHIYKDVTDDGIQNAFDCEFIGKNTARTCVDRHTRRHIARQSIKPGCNGKWEMDQMDKVIYDLKNTPFSRRIMTSMWNPQEQYEMHLAPCAYSMTYNVTEENGKLVLNAILNQRSQDMLAANGWNIAQYAILLMMLARETEMIPGELIHIIADAHIYDRHIDMIKELLNREEFDAPTVTLNPEINDFYDFTTDDLIIENYKFGEQIKNIPIAV